MPPFAGPRVTLCCTRYPSKTRSPPLSSLTGNRTTSSRRTSRNTARRLDERLRISAALSNCRCALSQGFSAASAGAAAMVTVPSLAGLIAGGTYTRCVPDEIDATPENAHAALRAGDAVLIDVREPWESDQMRIPGAVLIPLGAVPERLAEIPGDRDVYVHCRLGGRSTKAVEFLREHGRPRAYNVAGGIDAWKAAGLPV